MPPIARPLTANERRFNRAHRSTRRLIECTFGSFKESFQCLKKLRVKTPIFAAEIIKACSIIHNLRMPNDDATIDDDEPDDDEADDGDEDIGTDEDDEDNNRVGDMSGWEAGSARRDEIVAFMGNLPPRHRD
jgi:hypothetical protein